MLWIVGGCSIAPCSMGGNAARRSAAVTAGIGSRGSLGAVVLCAAWSMLPWSIFEWSIWLWSMLPWSIFEWSIWL